MTKIKSELDKELKLCLSSSNDTCIIQGVLIIDLMKLVEIEIMLIECLTHKIIIESEQTGIFRVGRVPMTFMFQQEFGERMICPAGFHERSRV